MFWQGKKVLVTGHTGFKGSWLCLWLQQLQADIVGYALSPATQPNLFTLARIAEGMTHIVGDITNYHQLYEVIRQQRPEIVIHMAAQSLVRQSYLNPIETYTTNVIGTLNLFEAIRQTETVKVILNITSDKCYRNMETLQAYKEDDPLGGCDPYSSSKACAELLTYSYYHSYFQTTNTALASARAGNVIGGGDWAKDRLIPDIMRAYLNKNKIHIRHPNAIRPWQHVLEPLHGYLLLIEKLYEMPTKFTGAWNFGPTATEDTCTVQEILNYLEKLLPNSLYWEIDSSSKLHEATYLRLDCTKAKSQLKWHTHFSLKEALKAVVDWFNAYREGKDMRTMTEMQIADYIRSSAQCITDA